MTSLIAWLDSTPEEQRFARELIGLFSETESRDELGIGQIRDAFSDLLFPGTSVIQTRARYYLFIPWCYTAGKAAGTVGRDNREAGHRQERRLIKTLRDAKLKDAIGLIGARTGPGIKTLPSTIYWGGMLTYGVRTYAGALGGLGSAPGWADGATELSERVVGEWDAGIPPAPTGFPDSDPGGFALTPKEAEWLRGRMVTAAPDSVLAHLLEQCAPITDDQTMPWLAVDPDDFEPLHHAWLFSHLMHGAALVYNLLVAQRYEQAGLTRHESPVADYEKYLDAWSQTMATLADELGKWDLERMWEITTAHNSNIRPQTQRFVEEWYAGVRSTRSVVHDQSLHALVRRREQRKGKQSRLLNHKMLSTWSGSSGSAPLGYRWGTVRRLVNDVLEGLSDDAGA